MTRHEPFPVPPGPPDPWPAPPGGPRHQSHLTKEYPVIRPISRGHVGRHRRPWWRLDRSGRHTHPNPARALGAVFARAGLRIPGGTR